MTDRPEHVVPVTSVPSEMEAGVVVAAIKEQGIKAVMSGVHTAGFRAEAPGQVQVLVAEEDLARVRQILEEEQEHPEAVDWSQVDVGEPEDE